MGRVRIIQKNFIQGCLSVRFSTLFDSWQDSLDEGSACRKASTYTGQHKTERRGETSLSRMGFKPTIQCSSGQDPRLRYRGQYSIITSQFSKLDEQETCGEQINSSPSSQVERLFPSRSLVRVSLATCYLAARASPHRWICCL
jgi:hypothetical protein